MTNPIRFEAMNKYTVKFRVSKPGQSGLLDVVVWASGKGERLDREEVEDKAERQLRADGWETVFVSADKFQEAR